MPRDCAAQRERRQIKVGGVRAFMKRSMRAVPKAASGENRAIRPIVQRTKNGDALEMTDRRARLYCRCFAVSAADIES